MRPSSAVILRPIPFLNKRDELAEAYGVFGFQMNGWSVEVVGCAFHDQVDVRESGDKFGAGAGGQDRFVGVKNRDGKPRMPLAKLSKLLCIAGEDGIEVAGHQKRAGSGLGGELLPGDDLGAGIQPSI